MHRNCVPYRIPLLAAASFLLACGGEGDVAPGAAAGTRADEMTQALDAVAPAVASGGPAADACTLLPAANVEAIVGAPVTDSLALAMPPGGSPLTLSQCNYASGGNPALVSLMLRRGSEGQSAQAASEGPRGTFEESGIPIEDVPGLGGTAFWGSNQLHVFGDAGWYIIVTPDAAAGLPQARALAENAVERLEGGA